MAMHVSGARVLIALSLLQVATTGVCDETWRDASPHRVRFIEVEPNVKLEVLQWGGRGRAIVLLAGGGHTAHVFDEFATRLTQHYRVFGITRRGYGTSSVPQDGYSADRLGDDVLAVIERLKLQKPVLIAHSRGGAELSSISSRHPDKVAGVAYMDAAYAYAFFDPDGPGLYGMLDWQAHLVSLQEGLQSLAKEPFDAVPSARELLDRRWPEFEKDLRLLMNVERGRPPRPDPVEADLQTFKTVQDWYARGSKVTIPEAEFRQMLVTDASGHPTMTRRSPRFVGQAIREGDGRFTDIRGPVLAIFAVATDTGKVDTSDPAAVEAANAYVQVQTARTKRRASSFQRGVPQARVVLIDRADHYVFLSNQAEVVRELRDFISSLGP